MAKYLWWKKSKEGSFEDMMHDEGVGLVCVARPQSQDAKLYDDFVRIYEMCEHELV